MKSLLGVLGFLCLGLSTLFAQNAQPEYRHEISLSGFNLQVASQPFRVINANPRLMYRLHLGRFAFRVQSSLLQRTVEWLDFNTEGSFQQDRSLTLGGQYTLFQKRLAAYVFADAGYGLIELNRGRVISSFIPFEHTEGLRVQSGFGLSYRFAKRWKLGLESAVSYTYGEQVQTPGGVDINDIRLIAPMPMQITNGSQLIFQPVKAFWISYSFGHKS